MDLEREKVLKILSENVSKDFLLKHVLAVEAGMNAYAIKYNQDLKYWSTLALLHDIDYEKYPETHPLKTDIVLEKYGYTSQFIEDIVSHGYEWDGKERSFVQKMLVAVDAIASFLIICAKKDPSQSIDALNVKSVIERLEDPEFAPYVDKKRIYTSLDELEISLEEHIDFMLKALSEAMDLPEYEIIRQK